MRKLLLVAVLAAGPMIASDAHACQQLLGGGWRCDTPGGQRVQVEQTLGGGHRYTYGGGGSAVERDTLGGGQTYRQSGTTYDLPMQNGSTFRPYSRP